MKFAHKMTHFNTRLDRLLLRVYERNMHAIVGKSKGNEIRAMRIESIGKISKPFGNVRDQNMIREIDAEERG